MAAIAPHNNNVTAPVVSENNPDNISQINTLESQRSHEILDNESPDDVVDIAVDVDVMSRQRGRRWQCRCRRD